MTDPIGSILLDEDAPWCAHVAAFHLSWDQWAVCEIQCIHGNYRASSGFLNLTEAVENANRKYRKADHPNYCLQEFLHTEGDEQFHLDCERWVGHEGPHGYEEGPKVLSPYSGSYALYQALKDTLKALEEYVDYTHGGEIAKRFVLRDGTPTSGDNREPQ